MSTSQVYFDGQVADGLDLSHEDVDGYLGLRGVESHGRIDLHCASTKGIASLKYATLTEKLHGWGFDVGSVLQMEWATIKDDAFLRGGSAREVRGRGLTVDGWLDLEGFDADQYDLRDATLGALRLGRTEATIDLSGATVEEVRVDDLSRYDLRVDDATHIDRVYQDTGLGTVELGEREQEVLTKIVEREQPYLDRSGSTFTYEQLRKDTCMDAIYRGAFGSLVNKGVVQELEDGQYVARADPL